MNKFKDFSSLQKKSGFNDIDVNTIYLIDTSLLLIKMMKDNYFSYDVFFRMAVIDEYIKNNDEIWHLYNKMQITRANAISRIQKNMIDHKDEFIELIESIKNNGYDLNKPILVDRDLYVIDGAHRISCALKFNIQKISIYTTKEFIDFIPNEYTKQWFNDNDLLECIPYAENQKKLLEKRIKNV